MKFLNLYSIKGPNIYSYNPVIVMEVDLEEHTRIYSNEIPDFIPTLLAYFPGLKKHHCCKNYAGGFVERLHTGTLLGHVMEHLALELQTMIAEPVHYGKTRYSDEINAYRIVFSYYHEALGLQTAKVAFQSIVDILAGKELDVQGIINRLEREYTNASYGPSTQSIIEVAQKRKIPVIPLSRRSSLVQLGYGSKQKLIQATITQGTSCIGVDIACDKLETKEIFGEMGLPVPKGYQASTLEEARTIMDKLGTPVVVKPVDGNQGKGVSLNISTPEELLRAFEVGQRYGKEVLIEEYIQGNDYRLTVVNGELAAASHRLPPFVVGDGVHNIRQLIQKVNADNLRGEGHEKPLTRIKIDQVVLMTIYRQGLTLERILPEGEKVFLRENGNLSTGGTAYDVTEMVHPENKQLVERAARIIGLDIAGIDLRTEDISRPISRYGGAIIEINAAPGIRMHHYPTAGKVRNVAEKIVDMLFPKGNGRIPIFAVTGTNGKTTTTRLIQHILLQTGKTVGMTTTDGIYVNRNLVFKGDTTGPWSSQVILKDSTVEMAVLETARGGIIRAGLGYDRSDVGIVLNVSDDHLGLAGIETLEDLARVKSLVAETVHKDGICVLNGDNLYTVKMAEKCIGEVIFFTRNPHQEVIQRHLKVGGRVIVADEEMIQIWNAGEIKPLISLKEIPMVWNGKAIHQVENVLAAIAGLYGYGMDVEYIVKGLCTFGGDIQSNPGRLNLIECDGWRLILDYGHNVEGYRSVINFAQKLGYQRLLGVVGVPGDRPDSSIEKVGHLVGDTFDQVWIKEDDDLRGRRSGQIVDILLKGISAGGQRTRHKIILNEKEALEAMLSELQTGDIGIIFYEKEPEKLLKIIEKYMGELQQDRQEKDLSLNKSSVFAVNSSR